MEILATIPTIRHSKQPGIPLCTTKCSGAFPGCPPGAGKDFVPPGRIVFCENGLYFGREAAAGLAVPSGRFCKNELRCSLPNSVLVTP